MTRCRLALAVVATLAVVTVLAGSGTVAAQTQTQTTENTTTTADSGSAETAIIQVSENVQVVDWTYDGSSSTMRVRLLVRNLPTAVTVADVLGPVQDAGASRVDSTRVFLEQGVSTVTVPVEEYRGAAAVSVATSEGAVYLSTGISPPNPFTAVGPTTAWFGGASVVVGMGILAVRRVRGSGPDEPEAIGE